VRPINLAIAVAGAFGIATALVLGFEVGVCALFEVPMPNCPFGLPDWYWGAVFVAFILLYGSTRPRRG